METSIIEFIGIVTITIICNFFIMKFFPSYFSEKGKNTATKEDIEEITKKIETVKSSIINTNKNLEKKRETYEKIVISLKIFQEGNNQSQEEKENFLKTYPTSWLWGSDDVLNALNDFLELQIQRSRNPSSITQEVLKKSYSNIILNMRKDVGFNETEIDSKNYKFIYF